MSDPIIEYLKDEAKRIEDQLTDFDSLRARLNGLNAAIAALSGKSPKARAPRRRPETLKSIVLRTIESAGPAGLRASQIRASIDESLDGRHPGGFDAAVSVLKKSGQVHHDKAAHIYRVAA